MQENLFKRAKRIRKKGENWQHAIQRAKKQNKLQSGGGWPQLDETQSGGGWGDEFFWKWGGAVPDDS